ncbi:MAG: hypothetical protein HZRFUVUK_000709 [Candidatus Fervidibacterota bacterium]|jgi:hypothetical protein
MGETKNNNMVFNPFDPGVEHAIATHKFSDALVALRAYCMLEALRSGVLEALEKTQGLKPPALHSLKDFIELCEGEACERYLRHTHPYAIWHANEKRLRRLKNIAIVDLLNLIKLL